MAAPGGLTPGHWWTKDLGATPVIAVGLAIGTVAVIVVIVAIQARDRVRPQQNLILQPPHAILADDPRGLEAVEPGIVCSISNLRRSQFPFGGSGGLPALMLDYKFPHTQQRLIPRVFVAVITEPGGKPATATLSPLTEDHGTMSIAPLDLGAFPRGTTVYFGDHLDSGPDGLPKRVSNILTLD